MKTSESIETEIEQTRGAMSDTLQAIERKLSPNRLVDEAMQTMRNFSISTSPVLDVIRDNPLPLIVAGIGLGWLALATLRGGGQSAGVDAAPQGELAGYDAGKAGGGNGAGAEAGSETADAALNAARADARTAVRSSEAMGRWTGSVRNRAGDLAARGSDAFQDHPVAVGFLAAAAGLAIGLALPLGRQGEDPLETADEGADDTLRKTGKVVREAAAAMGEGVGQSAQRAAESIRGESGATH